MFKSKKGEICNRDLRKNDKYKLGNLLLQKQKMTESKEISTKVRKLVVNFEDKGKSLICKKKKLQSKLSLVTISNKSLSKTRISQKFDKRL